ncbi:cytochrome c oxidase subunit II [Crocinitomix catalasitica]|uniref:cytochrome c oxidase subunit II n=1 Tax=Crocinitomix catalasitica TaxID=184607 RepID=UPI00146F9D3C|nr:cytochrome c oxidase subunit II [Crocinitomix catalasitica]
MKFIVLVVIVLVVIAVAQIMRVYELSKKIRGKSEADIDLRTNNINAGLMLAFLALFFGSFFYMLFAYGRGMLPNASSKLGLEVDWLYNVNWVIVILVFVITNSLLFVFAWKYAYDPKRRAHWFPHDNKLEMIWTVVPACVLAVIIILGLMTWNDITGKPSDDAKIIEIYGKQFDWTARYAGDDNKLGFADYKLVGAYGDYSNPLGVITEKHVKWQVASLDNQMKTIHEQLDAQAHGTEMYSVANVNKLVAKVEKLDRIKERLLRMNLMYGDSIDTYAMDDYMTKELFLVKDQEYQIILRSQDVLHSAYFPHFRAQMNCVPGMRTNLKFTPIHTTQEMREITGNPEFNFILMCNKICGVSHSNMKMMVYVGTQEEYDQWANLDEGNITMVVNDSLVAPEVNLVPKPLPGANAHGGGHGDHGDHGDDNHDSAH